MKRKKPVTIRESIHNMEWIVAHSYHLWGAVNSAILSMLQSHRSRGQMVATLNQIAGKRKQGEPCAVESYRTAARQIKCGELVSVL